MTEHNYKPGDIVRVKDGIVHDYHKLAGKLCKIDKVYYDGGVFIAPFSYSKDEIESPYPLRPGDRVRMQSTGTFDEKEHGHLHGKVFELTKVTDRGHAAFDEITRIQKARGWRPWPTDVDGYTYPHYFREPNYTPYYTPYYVPVAHDTPLSTTPNTETPTQAAAPVTVTQPVTKQEDTLDATKVLETTLDNERKRGETLTRQNEALHARINALEKRLQAKVQKVHTLNRELGDKYTVIGSLQNKLLNERAEHLSNVRMLRNLRELDELERKSLMESVDEYKRLYEERRGSLHKISEAGATTIAYGLGAASATGGAVKRAAVATAKAPVRAAKAVGRFARSQWQRSEAVAMLKQFINPGYSRFVWNMEDRTCTAVCAVLAVAFISLSTSIPLVVVYALLGGSAPGESYNYTHVAPVTPVNQTDPRERAWIEARAERERKAHEQEVRQLASEWTRDANGEWRHKSSF